MNIQHHCPKFSCGVTGTEIIQQERLNTTQTHSVVAHSDTHQCHHYVINTTLLHNYKIISRILLKGFLVPWVNIHDHIMMCHVAAEHAQPKMPSSGSKGSE